MKIEDLILELQTLQKKHGNKEVNVYCSYSKEFKGIIDTYLDEENDFISLGIYA